MKTLFVGIDISKDTLDVVACNESRIVEGEPIKVKNSIKGISELIENYGSKNHKLWVCFEHTGHYGLLLACQLEAKNIAYSAVPALEIKQSMGMVRGKSDSIDAERIALYAATNSHKLKPTELASESIFKIKQLLTYRSQLSDMLRQFKNSIKSHLKVNESIKIPVVIEDIESKIESLKNDIIKVENAIEELIYEDKELKKNYNLIKSVIGIGAIIAMHFLVYTNNFKTFDDPRKFNCYTGIAPFENSSGTSIRGKTRTSNLRNKKMKALLFNGAYAAVRCDKQLKKYYVRKKQEGKHSQVVINAVASKLISRVFAVVKRQSPFVEISY